MPENIDKKNGEIVVIEDNLAIRNLYKDLLKGIFAEAPNCPEISTHGDGKKGFEAIEKTLKDNFALVITDFNLPGMNGEEILNGIKKLKSKNPVRTICCSALPENIDLINSNNLANKTFYKPFNFKEFINYVISAYEELKKEHIAKEAKRKRPNLKTLLLDNSNN